MTAPKIYIDACCIIEALKKQRGLPLTHPLSEVDMIERIMRAARDEEIELHTSIITVGEVVHLGTKPPPADLKPQVERLILSGRSGILATAPTPPIVDGRLAKRIGKSDVRGCRIVSPANTSLLPDRYRSDDLFGKK
jgi:hypothetical protein